MIFINGISYGQNTSSDNEILSTQATDPKAKPDARKQGPKKKNYKYIIRNNSKGTLKGNKCFEEVTRKFGFEYLIIPKNSGPYRSGFSRWWHNLGVKSALFFKNGPFWQMRLNIKNTKNAGINMEILSVDNKCL